MGQVVNRAMQSNYIGFTAMTASINDVIVMAKMIKKLDASKFIIIGGVHASIFPEELFKTKLFNAVVVGEGETSILKILRTEEQGIYKSRQLDLDILPFPDYSLLKLGLYTPRYPHGINPPWVPASTSRGCPYSCSFCSKAVFGQTFRAVSPNRVFKMLAELKVLYGINDITFYDDLFTLNKMRVREICSLIIHSGMKMTWTCESRVNVADSKTLGLMALAGCRLIYYGIESGSQKMLDSINKGTNKNQIISAIRMTQAAGIHAAGYFMLGAPGETSETIQETLDFSRALNLDHTQFSVCSPMPGSKMYNDFVESGHIIPSWSNFQYLAKGIDKPMWLTDGLTAEYVENVVEIENARYAK